MNYAQYIIKPLHRQTYKKKPLEGFPQSSPPTNVVQQLEYSQVYGCPPTLRALLFRLGWFGEDVVRDSKNVAWLVRCKKNNERGRRLRDMMVKN